MKAKKMITVTVVLCMLFSIQAMAVSTVMEVVNDTQTIYSYWHFDLSKNYMGNGMYTFASSGYEEDNKKFDNVDLYVVAHCNAGSNVEDSVSVTRAMNISKAIVAYTHNQPTGTAYSSYHVYDVDYGEKSSELYLQ